MAVTSASWVFLLVETPYDVVLVKVKFLGTGRSSKAEGRVPVFS